MEFPLWFAFLLVCYLGVKLVRPPAWLIAVLLLAGFLLADTVFAPAIDTFLR